MLLTFQNLTPPPLFQPFPTLFPTHLSDRPFSPKDLHITTPPTPPAFLSQTVGESDHVGHPYLPLFLHKHTYLSSHLPTPTRWFYNSHLTHNN